MGFFSEELKIMDENTVKYMIEEMQSEIDSLKSEKEEQVKEIEELKTKLEQYQSIQK